MVSIVVVEEVSYGQLQSSAMLLGVKNGRAVNQLIILEVASTATFFGVCR